MNHDQHLEGIIAELPYWPSVSYLANLTNVKLLLLENCEHFVKSSNRNRCWITGANGVQLLSIPIAGGRSHKQLYNEVQIDSSKTWRRQHWHSIQSAYGKSPFFEFYAADLSAFYQQSENHLWTFNLQLLTWILQKLGMHLSIQKTEFFQLDHHLPDYRQSTPWRRKELAPYYQCFSEKHGFQTDLAALDLLLNLGPQASNAYLAQVLRK